MCKKASPSRLALLLKAWLRMTNLETMTVYVPVQKHRYELYSHNFLIRKYRFVIIGVSLTIRIYRDI